MTYQRTELRAFPRLRCAAPAQIRVDNLVVEGQVIDLSLGGCKFLPARLSELVEGEFRPGTGMTLVTRGGSHPAVLAWATPNYSALGCAFRADDEPDAGPFADLLACRVTPALAV